MSYPQPDTYRASFEIVKQLYTNKQNNDLDYFIATCAIATGVPCYIIVCFIEEIDGSSQLLTDKKNSLAKFYGYGKI